MIHTARFRNFKSLRDVEIKLGRLTAIVGPNGCGKTSVLQGIHILSMLGRTSPTQLFVGQREPGSLFTRGSDGPLELGLHWNAELDGEHTIELARPLPTSSAGAWPLQWQLKWRGEKLAPVTLKSMGTYGLNVMSAAYPLSFEAPPVGVFMDRIAYFRLDPVSLATPGLTDTGAGRLDEQGGNLPSVLVDMRLSRPEQFAEMEEALRAVIPEVKAVRHEKVQTDEGWKRGIVIDYHHAPSIPGHAASEGTLLVLGLLAGIFDAEPPVLVMLDDLDRALHPRAQRELVKLLRRLLERFPELQILATSHSPYLLDELAFDEVRVMTQGPDGASRCASLDEHPEIERWRDLMHPGEFWSTVGEDWAPSRTHAADA